MLERAGEPTYLIEIKSTADVNDNLTGVLEGIEELGLKLPISRASRDR